MISQRCGKNGTIFTTPQFEASRCANTLQSVCVRVYVLICVPLENFTIRMGVFYLFNYLFFFIFAHLYGYAPILVRPPARLHLCNWAFSNSAC